MYVYMRECNALGDVCMPASRSLHHHIAYIAVISLKRNPLSVCKKIVYSTDSLQILIYTEVCDM
jgi:hypothetical protein